MRSGFWAVSAKDLLYSCVSPSPYHESASEEIRRGGYGALTFKDLTVTRDVTSGLLNDGWRPEKPRVSFVNARGERDVWARETYL